MTCIIPLDLVRPCDNCAECCKTRDGKVCKHLDLATNRCTVYKYRPKTCRGYYCNWCRGGVEKF